MTTWRCILGQYQETQYFIQVHSYVAVFLTFRYGRLSEVTMVHIVPHGHLPVKESEDAACFLQQDCIGNVPMFSLHDEDLFYFMRHELLLIETRRCIARQILFNLQKGAGVSWMALRNCWFYL